VAAQNVKDESEVIWKNLSDPTWEWSGNILRKRWISLKEKIEGVDDGKTHSGSYLGLPLLKVSLTMWLEIVNTLKSLHAEVPAVAKGKKRTVSTANPSNHLPEAGPSNGPGTLAQADVDGQ
jgi:hypothetical protein